MQGRGTMLVLSKNIRPAGKEFQSHLDAKGSKKKTTQMWVMIVDETLRNLEIDLSFW